jgi:hypothetical protein
MEKMINIFPLFLLVFVVTVLFYQSEYKAEECEVRIRQDKSICFCNGLSMPAEKQCPSMDDL